MKHSPRRALCSCITGQEPSLRRGRRAQRGRGPSQRGDRHGVGTESRPGSSGRRRPGAGPCRMGGRRLSGEQRGEEPLGKAQERDQAVPEDAGPGAGTFMGRGEARRWERWARGDHAEPSGPRPRAGLGACRPGSPPVGSRPRALVPGPKNPSVGAPQKDDSQVGRGALPR